MRKFVLTAMVILAAAGCSDDEGDTENAESNPISGSFVGTVAGSGAYIAVVVAPDGDALAYVTDGGNGVDWLAGGLQGPHDTDARLGNDGGAMLEVTFDDSTASGTFQRPGYEALGFTARHETAPAGLYHDEQRFDADLYVGGWVVLPDGRQRGSVRRYETPLAPGEADPMTFSPGDKTFTVPAGVLKPRRVTPHSDF